jgi:hypothetical protein
VNIVKIISTEIDSFKRRIGKFLLYGRSDIRTAYEALPYGFDSNPISGMRAVYAETGRNGDTVLIGYLNVNQMADPGEVRIFSTDSNGNQKFYIWLKANGTMELGGSVDNAVRYSKLAIAFNQLKSDFNNHITAYNTHVHAGVTSGSSSSGPTPVPGVQSSADITPAKINEIKTL